MPLSVLVIAGVKNVVNYPETGLKVMGQVKVKIGQLERQTNKI